jgi:hypothetical protein
VAGAVSNPFDEMFLASAVLGEADYLVTGDKEVLALAEFGKAEIVPPDLSLRSPRTFAFTFHNLIFVLSCQLSHHLLARIMLSYHPASWNRLS